MFTGILKKLHQSLGKMQNYWLNTFVKRITHGYYFRYFPSWKLLLFCSSNIDDYITQIHVFACNSYLLLEIHLFLCQTPCDHANPQDMSRCSLIIDQKDARLAIARHRTCLQVRPNNNKCRIQHYEMDQSKRTSCDSQSFHPSSTQLKIISRI